MSLARSLYERWQVLVHEIAKFGIVGAVNTVLHFGLFNLLSVRFGVGPLTSNGIAIAVAATSSYFMNREWTFRHRARRGLRREYSMFFLLNGVGLVISEACLGFTHYVLGYQGQLAHNAALVAGVALGTLFRFLTYKRWVFLASDPSAAPAEPQADLESQGDLEPPGDPEPRADPEPQAVTVTDAKDLAADDGHPASNGHRLVEPGGDHELSGTRNV
jgi:putative flippase GtrA